MKIKLAFFLWLVPAVLFGQNQVQQAEYFFDSDPGFDQATQITVTPGTDVTISFTANLSALTDGFHTLYVRVRNDSGWSISLSKPFFKESSGVLSNTAHLEYYIDTDPGLSQGTPVTIVSPGTDITQSFTADLSGMNNGFHVLYIRAADANGIWSTPYARPFLTENHLIGNNVTDAEYFIDTDPGFGQATPVPIASPGSGVTQSFTADLSGASNGFHVLYVRVKDTGNEWSIAYSRAFLKEADGSILNIAFAEYFIDADPGIGGGTPINISSPTPNITENFNADLSSVSVGFHILYVRVQDSGGSWSIPYSKPFIKDDNSQSPIASIDYYYVKHGVSGQHFTKSNFTPSTDVTLNLCAELNGLQQDSVYELHAIAKLSNGIQSHEGILTFTVDSAAVILNKLPYVQNMLPDVNPNEDFDSMAVANLNTVFSDSNLLFCGDSLIFNAMVSQPLLTATVNSAGNLILYGLANLNGTTTVIVTATDDSGASVSDSFLVTIQPVNDAPVAVNDNASATGGVAKVIHVLNNDSDLDGNVLSVVSLSTPSHGTAVKGAGDTTITYTASINFSGSDQFTYSISDGQGGLDTATVTMTVSPGGTLSLSTSVLQNPALSKYADFYVVADTTLSGMPSVKLFVGTDSSNVTMSATSNVRIYKGSVTFTQSGNYTLRSVATAVTGAFATNYHAFNVVLSKPGLSAALSSVNGRALLKIGAKAVKEETYFTALEDKEAQETIYEFGPKIPLNESVELTIAYDPQSVPDAGKLFIYHKEGEVWTRLRTQVYAGEQTLKTRVSTLGQFKVGYDASYEGTNIVPSVFALKQNYPNPFNPSTTIAYDVPEDTRLNLTIYNLLGQKVKTLFTGNQIAGTYHTVWNGTNERGQTVASGIYFYRLETQSFIKTQKMLLIK